MPRKGFRVVHLIENTAVNPHGVRRCRLSLCGEPGRFKERGRERRSDELVAIRDHRDIERHGNCLSVVGSVATTVARGVRRVIGSGVPRAPTMRAA